MERAVINTIIGRNIKHYRLLQGLSQKAVGNHLGITFQQMQKYENGINAINCEKLIQLTELFRCSVNDLCRDAVDDTAMHNPEHPWNPYKVHALISHFNRIRSRKLRNQACGIMRILADISCGKEKEML